MPPDLFEQQRRVDEFRAALGSLGRELDRSAELDELLDAADRNLWTMERLGHYLAGRLPRGAGTGLVVITLRTIARSPEPAAPSQHQLDAHARRRPGTFRQPLPPCGGCDGSPARWRRVPTPAGSRSLVCVVHCPVCWTAPPGYVPPAARREEAHPAD